MTDINEYFRAALSDFLKPRGAQARLSRKSGIGASNINNIIKRRDNGSDTVKRTLAAALGYPERRFEEFLEIGRAILEGRPLEEPSLLSENELENQGFIKIPFSLDMKLAAGDGGSIPVDYEAEQSTIIIHGPTLKVRSAKDLQAFRVGGDSMEPEIAQGGIVLVNKTHNRLDQIKDGSIYMLCWEDDGLCAVKRLRWASKPRLLAIESTNSANYPTLYKSPKEIHQLIGKVIWAWREFE